MLPGERRAGGLTCSQVMAALSDYVDGELTTARAAEVEAHVAECQQCARFGRGFSMLLAGMRRHLAAPPPVTAELERRLRDVTRS